MKKRVAAVGLGLLVMAACGCGGEKTGTVAGRVDYQGKPLPGGFIDFISDNGRSATGRIEPNGSYVVSGVPIGPAKISVRDLSGAMGARSEKEKAIRIPLRYRSAEGSGLRYTVTSGRQDHDVQIQD
jgi:hypothetical protein